jgi:hypothetical protein
VPHRFPENEVRRYRCDKWSDFTDHIRKVGVLRAEGRWNFPGDTLFRGHARPEWRLQSPLERNLTMQIGGGAINLRAQHGLGWYDEVCAQVLKTFRTLVRRLPQIAPPSSDDELWALGRHHGLVTPLLDWTTSPYVAAFFALTEAAQQFTHGAPRFEAPEGDVFEVWGLRLWAEITVAGEFEILDVEPPDSRRQQAQSGRFTRLRHSRWLDIQSYLQDRGLSHYLECYTIPYTEATLALRDLELMNITYSTLFPDLHGAAQQANVSTGLISFMLGVSETPIEFSLGGSAVAPSPETAPTRVTRSLD